MSKSNAEEIIGILWIIAAILCFANNYTIFGYILLVKGVLDNIVSIWLGFE